MKNKIKNGVVSASKSEFEHFTGILMEKMDSSVKTVAEQYGSLAERIDDMAGDVRKLKEDMSIVRPAVESNSADICGLKADVGDLKIDVKDLKTDMAMLKNDMAIVRPVTEANSKDLKEIKSELHYVKMAVMETSHDSDDLKKRVKRVEEKVII